MSDKKDLVEEAEDLHWLDELSAEPPIFPSESKKHGQSKQVNYNSKGWKYYMSVKSKLPEWWEEFNDRTKDSGPYYKNVRAFVKTVTKNHQEREWLMQMFGPAPDPSEKREVPWLADWNKRRKNGYWNTEDGYEFRRIARIIRNNLDANEAIRAGAPFIVKDLVRYEKLQQRIEEAFNGKPFNENKSALSPVNRARFKTYFKMMSMVSGIKSKLLRDWMRINGINPDNPAEMRDMATLAMMSGKIGAASALTGAVAGQGMLQPGDNPVTRDAVLLALQLSQHKEAWKKELPPVDGKVISMAATEKPNGKHRTQ